MNIINGAQISGINVLKDGTIKLSLHLQEMEAEKSGTLYKMMNQFVKLFLTTENVTNNSVEEIKGFEFEVEEKSPSRRMRNVFFRLWEQDKEGYEDFNLYYRWKMEKLINHLKDRLV